jgi:hypothetical protein
LDFHYDIEDITFNEYPEFQRSLLLRRIYGFEYRNVYLARLQEKYQEIKSEEKNVLDLEMLKPGI